MPVAPDTRTKKSRGRALAHAHTTRRQTLSLVPDTYSPHPTSRGQRRTFSYNTPYEVLLWCQTLVQKKSRGRALAHAPTTRRPTLSLVSDTRAIAPVPTYASGARHPNTRHPYKKNRGDARLRTPPPLLGVRHFFGVRHPRFRAGV
jgi:hypothetical protein